MKRLLTDPWELGGLSLPNRLVLAPLAGIGNWFVRLQAKRHGAGLVVSEMVSSFGLKYGDERTHREFLRIHPEEHPVAIQLFGHDPEAMRVAAGMAAERGADLIDINMGCPVRKVCKTGAGASLLEAPVIISGGLADERTLDAFEQTGADGAMLARGSLGNPWRFARLLGAYEGDPSTDEVVQELRWVIEAAEDHLGSDRAGRYLRKFYPWYAETLGLSKKAAQPLLTAPTTAHARAF